jgi:predicted AAA+ superfamily ATPase
LRHELPDALFIDLLRPEEYRALAARPERLRELIEGSPDRGTIVVDEVQRVLELFNVVHELLESASRPPRFVLTGSSARKLRRGGVDLLAGRALMRTMPPFLAAEVKEFSLEEALRFGMLPLVRSSKRPVETLAAYATLYLEQEVRAEGWARDVGSFARFLEAIAFSHGSVLNVAAVARECELERRTVAGYVEVLEDLLLSFRVPVFTRRARRATIVHPKLYLFDTGVFRSLRRRGPLDRPEEAEGAAFEGLVAQHLRAWVASAAGSSELFFWRTPAGLEVDFVVYGERGFWAIEVKGTDRVRPEDLRSLRAFREDYPEAEAILLYRGRDRLRIDDIWCLPAERMLTAIRPGRGLAEWL